MGELFGEAGATPEGLRGIADQARARILADPPGTGFIAQLFEGMTLEAQMESVLMDQPARFIAEIDTFMTR